MNILLFAILDAEWWNIPNISSLSFPTEMDFFPQLLYEDKAFSTGQFFNCPNFLATCYGYRSTEEPNDLMENSLSIMKKTTDIFDCFSLETAIMYIMENSKRKGHSHIIGEKAETHINELIFFLKQMKNMSAPLFITANGLNNIL